MTQQPTAVGSELDGVEGVGVIDIRRPRSNLVIAARLHDPPPGADRESEPIEVAEVIAAMHAHRAAGARVLLFRVDSLGSHSLAALALYNAILDFREAGGIVVAHIEKVAASTASIWPLAADYIVMAADAKIAVHGARNQAGTWRPLESPEQQRTLAIYATRTMTPRADLETWLQYREQPSCAILSAGYAGSRGWVDFIGDEQVAALICRALAAGAHPKQTERQERLARRGELPEYADAMRQVRAITLGAVLEYVGEPLVQGIACDTMTLAGKRLDETWIRDSMTASTQVSRAEGAPPSVLPADKGITHATWNTTTNAVTLHFSESLGSNEYVVLVQHVAASTAYIPCWVVLSRDALSVTLRPHNYATGALLDIDSFIWAFDVMCFRRGGA